MNRDFVESTVLFRLIQARFRSLKTARSKYYEELEQMAVALQDFGAMDESDSEAIGEKNSEVERILNDAIRQAEAVNADAQTNQ
jgi:hypothetical protein